MVTPQWALERIQKAKEKKLTVLNLSGWQTFDPLTEIPNEIFGMSQLISLDLYHNRLTSLPESIKELQNLTALGLSHNQLIHLPESITKLQNLTSLGLTGNLLTSLPDSIIELQNLTWLGLSLNQLVNLPESITKLRNLLSLNLGHNQLTTLPEAITSLQNLVSLDLSYNQLEILPEPITALRNLTSLDLSHNQLTNLPRSITQLQNLKSLDLRQNQLTSLPESITRLQNLMSLGLSLNHLTSLPESITLLQSLEALYLSLNQLTSLPKSITRLQNLRTLVLTGNGFTSLPEPVTKLQNLTTLVLTGNRFTSLPDSTAKLQNLTTLVLTGNRFVSLPEPIARLGNLTSLDLSHNQLTSLSDSIAKLQNLTALNLTDNQLTNLPQAITKLHNLTALNASHNQLTRLPESITRLQNLASLDLRHNLLNSMPASITLLQNLTSLDLTDNQLAIPPQEVAEKGIKAIREYFRQLNEQGEDQLYEAKMLILGEGGAGKTTLAKKIEDSNYILQDEKSTEGILVSTWSFPIDAGKSFCVNIWDFGGQEIYHATHQFFLTRRSLYILLADTRREDTDFYYWLNVVELWSENSPLLIVKNEKQDRHRDLNENQLRGQFENLKEILAVNFATNRGLDKLRIAIEHHIKNLPHIGSPLPKIWVRVRAQLENDPRNYISLEEYLAICKENGITETKDSLQLSSYLNDIGVFLHFQDEPLLNKTVILKPTWGTDAVYKVLDNQMVIKNLGRFTRADVNAIWQTPSDEAMRDELLQLMMKFKLCYEVPTQRGVYIAPQLLTGNQPKYEWNEEENLLLRYTYEFMPRGILLQFMVVMSMLIWDQNIWKSGVVLEKDKTRAEVIKFYEKREIHVRVVGAHKKELMTIVLHELDKIHATYKHLRVDKLIPCNCMDCKTKQKPYFYRFEILQKFVEDRQNQIQCQQSYKMVYVRGLIDDVLEKAYMHKEFESPLAQYIIHGDYIDQGEKKMTDNKIVINNSTIHGSVVAAENIKESFNTIETAPLPNDLKEQLKQLTQAVNVMIQTLPKEQAEEVADDMKRLAEEVVKPVPNKKWYSVSIEGLKKVADNLGEVGEPVLRLAGKVLALLVMR